MSSDKLSTFYESQLRESSDEARQVGWESSSHQLIRFEGLLQALSSEKWAQPVSVLDVGCGLGGLFAYLKQSGRHVDYTGIDISEAMILGARERFPEGRFLTGDVLELTEHFDLVLGCGTLGVRFGDPEDSWKLISHLYSLCRHALSFNLLLQRADGSGSSLREEYWRVNPIEAYSRLSQIGGHLKMRQDILPTDLVVYLYRNYLPIFDSATLRQSLGTLGVAELFIQHGLLSQALQTLQEGQPEAESSDWAQWNHLMALVMAYEGSETATAFFQRAHSANCADIEICASAVQYLIAQNELDRALNCVLKTVNTRAGLVSERDFLRQTVHEALVLGRIYDGCEALEKAVETDFCAALMVGWRLLKQGQLAQAETYLEQACTLQPHDLRAVLYLAYLAKSQERAEPCLRHAAHILQVEPGHREARSLALYALGALKYLSEEKRAEILAEFSAHPILGALLTRGRNKHHKVVENKC